MNVLSERTDTVVVLVVVSHRGANATRERRQRAHRWAAMTQQRRHDSASPQKEAASNDSHILSTAIRNADIYR
jgi:hypothetical protein